MKHLTVLTALLLLALGAPASADPVLGTWASPPDHKGQTGHMHLSRCGAAICGTLVRAFTKAGAPTVTPNVGKLLLWDMVPNGGNAYRGRVYVPLMKGEFPAEVLVSGNRLTVRGCNRVGLCRAQTWTRVN